MSVAKFPLPCWPLMLSDEMAAAFLSVPVAAFLRAVAQGSLPAPRLVAGKRRWSRLDLERVLHADIHMPAGEAEEDDPLMQSLKRWVAA